MDWRCLQSHVRPRIYGAAARPYPGSEGLLTWLGGGHWRELGERHERSTHAVAGAVVLFGAVLAWIVASLAVSESARWPVLGHHARSPLSSACWSARWPAAPPAGPPGAGQASWDARRSRWRSASSSASSPRSSCFPARSTIVSTNGPLRNADSTPAVAQASASLQQTRGRARRARQRRRTGPRAAGQGLGRRALRIQPHTSLPADPDHRRPRCRTRNTNGKRASRRRAARAGQRAGGSRPPSTRSWTPRSPASEQALTEARHSVVADAGRRPGRALGRHERPHARQHRGVDAAAADDRVLARCSTCCR